MDFCCVFGLVVGDRVETRKKTIRGGTEKGCRSYGKTKHENRRDVSRCSERSKRRKTDCNTNCKDCPIVWQKIASDRVTLWRSGSAKQKKKVERGKKVGVGTNLGGTPKGRAGVVSRLQLVRGGGEGEKGTYLLKTVKGKKKMAGNRLEHHFIWSAGRNGQIEQEFEEKVERIGWSSSPATWACAKETGVEIVGRGK